MPAEIIQPRTYLKVFASLLVLLALTVGANFLPLGPFSVAVALGISAVKTMLIILFFMEVRYSPPIVWLFAAAGFVWLMLLLIFSLSDYATRGWNSADWRAGTNGMNHVEFTPSHGASRQGIFLDGRSVR